MQYLRRNPEKAEQIRAAQNQPARGADLARDKANAIIVAIASGKPAAAACKAHGVNVRKFQALCRADVNVRRRYAAAQRQRGGKAVSEKPRRRWKDADFDAALRFVSNYGRPGIIMPEGIPSLASCERRAAVNEEFGEQFRKVMAAHVAATISMRNVAIADISLLHQALLRDAIYAAGWRRFKGFDPAERDDLISEFIVRVLRGEIEIVDIDKQKFRRDIIRQVAGPDRTMASLSTSQYDSDGAVELGDTVASPCPIQHY